MSITPKNKARHDIEREFDKTRPGSAAWWRVMATLNVFDRKNPNIWVDGEPDMPTEGEIDANLKAMGR